MVDVIITGVGGQGTVSMGHLIATTLTDLGIEFVAAETHGMSQRGGSVIFHLRIGQYKYSPLIEEQTADVIIAGEPMEALRSMNYLKPDGLILTDERGILSPVASQMGFEYPDKAEIIERISEYTSKLYQVPATSAAVELGSEKVANIILLGALLEMGILPLTELQVIDQISAKWPRFVDLNTSALNKGKELIRNYQTATH